MGRESECESRAPAKVCDICGQSIFREDYGRCVEDYYLDFDNGFHLVCFLEDDEDE